MVISARHIRGNVIMPSVVYLMVIKYVPEYSRRGSGCVLMSLHMKERLENYQSEILPWCQKFVSISYLDKNEFKHWSCHCGLWYC